MSKFLLLYRPSTFPPLYEECQGSQDFSVCTPQVVVPTDGMYMSMSLAPPLYSQNNSEITDPSWCWEQPPPYSQAVEMQQGQGHQGEQEEAASAHWHNPFCFPVEGIETFRLKKKKLLKNWTFLVLLNCKELEQRWRCILYSWTEKTWCSVFSLVQTCYWNVVFLRKV